MASTILVVWLGLWGPVDLEKLKGWQPLMAALIALGAGTLAYRGAIAKVNLDREEAERKRNGERLGMFVRFRTSLERVHLEAVRCIDLIENNRPHTLVQSVTLTAQNLIIYVPPELEEAWNRIDVFPAHLVESIESLRRLLPLIASELEKFSGERQLSLRRRRYLLNQAT